MKKFSKLLIAVAVLGFVLISVDLPAQMSRVNGNLSGTVVDSSGAVIPAATAQIRNIATGQSRTADSDASGQFQIRELPSGSYHLTITHQGFSTYDIPNISISVG